MSFEGIRVCQECDQEVEWAMDGFWECPNHGRIEEDETAQEYVCDGNCIGWGCPVHDGEPDSFLGGAA